MLEHLNHVINWCSVSFVCSLDLSISDVYNHNITEIRTSIKQIVINFREDNLGEATSFCCLDFLSELKLFAIVNVNFVIHSATNTVWWIRILAESNGLHRFSMCAENARAKFTCFNVAPENTSFEVARYAHWVCWMKSKTINWCFMESMFLDLILGLDYCDTFLFDWWPNSNAEVLTRTYNHFATISELCFQHFIFVTTKAGQEVASCTIQEVDRKVFTSTNNCITFWMPLNKIDVVLCTWAIL